MFITKRCEGKLKIDPIQRTQDLKVNWHAERIIETYFNEKNKYSYLKQQIKNAHWVGLHSCNGNENKCQKM